MTNVQIADVFRRLAALLELGGENFFKVRSYQSAAETIEDWPQPLMEIYAEKGIAGLRELPGIGEWTAQYIAMRTLAWPDAFPHTDLVVMQQLGTGDKKEILRIAEAWRPWRSYAVMHLWRSASHGL